MATGYSVELNSCNKMIERIAGKDTLGWGVMPLNE